MILYSCDECGLPFTGPKRITLTRYSGEDVHFDYIGCLTDWAAANGYRDDDGGA